MNGIGVHRHAKKKTCLRASLGWRTFRVRGEHESLHVDEVICPASEEAEHSTTCLDCQLCRGQDRKARSVAIIAHGQRVKWFSKPDEWLKIRCHGAGGSMSETRNVSEKPDDKCGKAIDG